MTSPARWIIAAVIGATPVSAKAQIAVVGPSIQERIATPGSSYAGTVVVINRSDRRQEAKIYQSDYQFSADGSNQFAAAGSGTRSNGHWVEVSPAYLRLAPGESVPVSYTVRVPAVDSLSGTYWSLMLIEGVPLDTVAAPPPGSGRMSLQPIIRFGIQVVTQVGSASTRTAEFSDPHLVSGPEDQVSLQVDLRNTGPRGFRPIFSARLFDTAGVAHSLPARARELLYPGSSVRQSFDLSALAPGPYTAIIVADTGEDEIFAAQYKLRR